MKAEKVIASLEKQIATMRSLGPDYEVPAFALIIAPEAEPIEIITLGYADPKTFYNQVAGTLQANMARHGYDGVTTPGMQRR